MVDSGVYGAHQDLINNISTNTSYDFTGETPVHNRELLDDYGHGTQVAGIIAGMTNNNIGITGIAQNVMISSLKVDDILSEKTPDQLAAAINYANSVNIKILNISLGFATYQLNQNSIEAFRNAVENFEGLIVCSAGNESTNLDVSPNMCIPASFEFDNLIVVGATDKSDNNVSCSNYGKESVDLFAPGEEIITTASLIECTSTCTSSDHITHGYHKFYNTSAAAPHVTGVAVLLMSMYPNMLPSEIKQTIVKNVDVISSLSNKCVSSGRLNAYKALSNPHFHSKSYSYNSTTIHNVYCECGYFYGLESHEFDVHTCNKCNYVTNSHIFKYEKLNNTKHIATCDCGHSEISAHVISSSNAGLTKAPCILCGAIIVLDSGIGMVPGVNSIRIDKVTENGSYILPNGVIILVEDDYEALINGTLIFYNKDDVLK